MVEDVRGKTLRGLSDQYGNKRHPLCSTCRVKSLSREEDTCAISYSPKAWFKDGGRCPRLAAQERELPFKKIRRGTEGKFDK